jgi:hypothetical protein
MICRAMKPLPFGRLLTSILGVAAVAWASASQSPPSATVRHLRVAAGAHDRRNTPVSVLLPSRDPAAHYELRDDTGGTLPLQVDRDGRAWFVLPSLAAGSERTYTLGVRHAPARSELTATTSGSDLAIAIGRTPVLSYVGGAGHLPSPDIKPAFQRGGYIHPVRTPSGRIVTDDYPADHRHQHGVMFAWTSAEFEGRKTDFWNMGNSLGRVEAVSVDVMPAGAVYAGWMARHRYVDLTSGAPKAALNEEWTTRVYTLGAIVPAVHLFDVEIRQRPATAAPLVLPEYHYGGMAVRGAASFMGPPDREIVLTSEGKNRADADATPARWAHIAGTIDGQLAGIAMLGHPDNFRAPEPLRVHPVDPYICFAPSRGGAWAITTERPYVARYRFVAADGAADATLLNRLWRDFATPPTVTVH